jgi:glutamate/tyrosine decarboxylase-like PLP-dependent enzyme
MFVYILSIAFDFALPGVTTMSCDTHKYGYALKGSSVLLFRSTEYRQAMYFCYSDWSGGVYATPTIAGSKSGGMVAQTWASMMAMGERGYMRHVGEIMQTARAIADGVREIKGLRILGGAQAMLVCFTGTDGLNIYRVHDKMTEFGWHLNAVQNPPAMNICVTAKHVGQDQQLLRDLRESVRFVLENPNDARGSTATLYGTTSALPPGPVNELVKVYLDVVYKTAPLN